MRYFTVCLRGVETPKRRLRWPSAYPNIGRGAKRPFARLETVRHITIGLDVSRPRPRSCFAGRGSLNSSNTTTNYLGRLNIRNGLVEKYEDVLNPAALESIAALASLNVDRQRLMRDRMDRRLQRMRDRKYIEFLANDVRIPRTNITVKEARAGQFDGGVIPKDLERQWVQGTGPGTKPGASVEVGIRNVAYALLSGADGWMFDGEDALGQIGTMSLDNQRNLKIAFARQEPFMRVAETVSQEMNAWAKGFLGREIISDWKQQLEFTTRIFRARGLHLDDRHVRDQDGSGFSASIVDVALYVTNNYKVLQAAGSSIVLYLPKIQTAEEAALWNDILSSLEQHLGLEASTIKTYVLVEQIEACFQLMEIRAVLGRRFIGFNTGRWDYINSVSDSLSWDGYFVNPNIDAITMTFGYMKVYEDRVRRCVNTEDKNGNYALWQGGMEPNIPVGSEVGVANGMKRAVAGGEREQNEGASGKWVAHWKMVHIIRPIWEKAGQKNQRGRMFDPLIYTRTEAKKLRMIENAARTVRGARDLISVALQYGNAFARGYQAAALKPADFFGNDDVLYLMEDMATGEIRLSILWEWMHKGATFTDNDTATGVKAGDKLSAELFQRLLDEEYAKLIAATNKDVHDDSKRTTLPVAREIVDRYVRNTIKGPWYIDLLNLNLGNENIERARERIDMYFAKLEREGVRITENLDL